MPWRENQSVQAVWVSMKMNEGEKIEMFYLAQSVIAESTREVDLLTDWETT